MIKERGWLENVRIFLSYVKEVGVDALFFEQSKSKVTTSLIAEKREV